MYLNKIYSEPPGLFQEVFFKSGVNFIFGKKDDTDNPKASLNSIGKSTFLDLIDFCLLASFQKSANPRLYSAKELMSNHLIVLEFSIAEKTYIIKRSVDAPKDIFFGPFGKEKKYKIDVLKPILTNLIFKNKEYPGYYNENWFRSLMLFYLKIQKHKKDQFLDPINYIKELKETEINVYQLFLLGIDNTLSQENLRVRTDFKRINPTVKEVERLLDEKYGLKNQTETSQNINRLKYEINKLEESINDFHLGDEYDDVEKEANKLTKKIKDFLFNNFSDKRKIELYKESYKLPDKISTTRIKNIYDDLEKGFALQAKKILDEAVKFRKKLSESRKSFLENEINTLEKAIWDRSISIKQLEEDRAKIFKFLSAKEAIKDLTEAFNVINERRKQLSELESNTKVLNDLMLARGEIEKKQKEVETEMLKYVLSLQTLIEKYYKLFTSIYNEIYVENQNESNFSINFNKKKDKYLDINISMPDMFGKGKNQGRTLVYDLFLLLNSFKFSSNFPRFIIHDGIFDGVDKAHFIAVCDYIEKLANSGVSIQYITTVNEEGTLSDKFGNADKYNPEEIEKQAILVLSPNKKLFNMDFRND